MSESINERDALELHLATHTKENSWWAKDAKGIELARVCEKCESKVLDRYNPVVTGHAPGRYEDVVQEPIEPEDYY